MKGGVHVVDTPEIIAEKTEGMIGYNLITHQTTAEGLPVNSVLVHEAVDIDKQIYLAFLHDRKNQGLCCVYSKKGGMDIEACLLYTSPSPRDQRGSRMPSSA